MTRFTPQWLQSGTYAAAQDRRLIGALWPAAASSGCAVAPIGGSMSVSVAPGSVAVPTQNNSGATLCTSDASETVTLTAAPASGLNRIDLIICRPRGGDLDGGANNDFIFDFVTGNALASPTVPATPPGTAALAQVLVPGGSAAIVAGNITDVRPGNLAIPVGMPATAPRGRVATTTGPSTAVVCNQTPTTIITLAAALTAGRRYRVTVFSFGQQSATASADTRTTISDTLGNLPAGVRVLAESPGPASAFLSASFVWDFTAAGSATDTFTLAGQSTTTGTFTATANLSQISLEDIGV